jgi:hypothetical protein
MKADQKTCNLYFKMHYTHYIVPTLTTTKEVEEKAITRNEEI